MANQPAVDRPPREQWSGQAGFLFAAIGSAIGLGNIWRFPGVAYSNGGGAFLIPYLVALLVVGIPILLLDYALGHRYRGSAPTTMRRLWRPAETLGWFQVMIAFVIATFYAVIIAWALRYTIFSLTLAWGDDPATFFTEDFLQAAGEGVSLAFVPGVLVPLLVVWVIVVGILAMGVRNGLERANVIFLPLLFLAFGILVVRALFLPGAAEGLNALFTPDFAALADPAVWIAAFGQIFFSLSIAFGIMITYASYLKRRSNLTGTGLTAAFANSSFELLAGLGVFAVLGFMSLQSQTPIDEMSITGVGLSFIAFPQIISLMPGGALIGTLFFGSLVVAGLTSLISVVQVISAAFQDRFGLTARTGALAVGIPCAIVSCLLFSTTTGLVTLDTVDKFTNEFGIVGSAIATVVIVGHLARQTPALRAHLNDVSRPRIGSWWEVLIKWLIPAVLLIMLLWSGYGVVTEGYEGYAGWFLGVFGWGALLFMLVMACVLTALPRRPDEDAEFAATEAGGTTGQTKED
ncbi:NSS family neurotransmitter:Na+ symporter [Naumannella cuiyingiana]|uniref:NSS family neurotransmitter:Na+ symporter n=1 Tax=Naumannella cuiyingiana TaxID=1347891 RepID=A0A7Z0D613_9ACTN|nr:sodium-dependent transporter [Naumannella cuiyingiana]NYI69474.1 NSS family neurotransmitter:Na+ symporter [Naumannella cuiyingiana]